MAWFRRPPVDRRFTRVFFTTDIHGSDTCWGKFLNAAKAYEADALVLGGDLTGKMVIPVIREQDRWSAELFGEVRTAGSEAELEAIERAIRTNGFYPYRTTPEEADELRDDRARLRELFLQVMRDSIARWVELAEARLRETEVACYVQLGNDDPDELAPLLQESEALTYVDGRVVRLDERHEMACCGYANLTPWRLPRDLPEDELHEKLEDVIAGVEDPETAVFNFHVPPRDSTIDTAPELTADLRPVLVGGQPNLIGVGSTAVRDAIERYQPLLSVHGHIHESRGVVRIGRTICINPGSEYGEGILHGVLLNLRDGKLLSHQLVAG
jgi:uncharacterized protein